MLLLIGLTLLFLADLLNIDIYVGKVVKNHLLLSCKNYVYNTCYMANSSIILLHLIADTLKLHIQNTFNSTYSYIVMSYNYKLMITTVHT